MDSKWVFGVDGRYCAFNNKRINKVTGENVNNFITQNLNLTDPEVKDCENQLKSAAEILGFPE